MNKTVLPWLVAIFPLGFAWAEEPVYFVDPNLKAAVEEQLWVLDPTPTDMLGLISLRADSLAIADLTGLEYARNLQTLNVRFNRLSLLSPLSGLGNLETLDLRGNRIRDLSPLSGLANLEAFYLNQNSVSDLAPLSGLTNLQILDIHSNLITDVSALSTLTNVWDLALRENPLIDISPLSALSNLEVLSLLSTLVSDVSPLCSLTSLRLLDLRFCPLSQDSHEFYIPQIRANNPHMFIKLDLHAGRVLSVSSTAGGSVIDPGEGEFTYTHDTAVRLEVRPEPGFIFAGWSVTGWSGTYPISLDRAWITMAQDYEIRASFLSLRDVLYVDDDGPADPGPEDPQMSDPNENGTAIHSFDRIQEAIEVAAEGTTIIVRPGIYCENIDLLGKNLRLMGMNPNDPNRAPWPVIEGTGNGPVVRFDGGEGPECVLMGFVITRGQGQLAGAILCEGASPTIAHCLIVGNRSTDPDGAVVYCDDSQAVLTNCTMADNYAGVQGTALRLIDSDVTVLNSILWNDTMLSEILATGTSLPDTRYCAVRGWWPDWGNIHKNPLFARSASWVSPNDPNEILGSANNWAVWVAGDYHLQSQAGRWDPDLRAWVRDEVTSPCIDAGLPTTPVGHEPAPNGDRINMGVYGGTAEASKSSIPTASP